MDKTTIAALLFVVMIVIINFFMYGIVRGFARGGKSNIFDVVGKALNPARKNQKDPMDELREKVDGLKGESGKKDSDGAI